DLPHGVCRLWSPRRIRPRRAQCPGPPRRPAKPGCGPGLPRHCAFRSSRKACLPLRPKRFCPPASSLTIRKFLICSPIENRNNFMRHDSRHTQESPFERAKVEQIVRADIAAFGAGRAKMANAIVDQSGLRVRPERSRGRSAGINPSGRFEPVTRHVFDDGWETLEDLPPFKTEVQVERPRTIVTRNDSPDISFDRSINPYRGCEHGCVYCFARPTHSYMGLSPGLDFESKLFAKPDAAKLLDKELSKEGYQPRTIAIGTNTDPYQPVEKQWRIMREILEVLDARNHPVGIVTKSALVTRDIDILSRMRSEERRVGKESRAGRA